MTWAASGVMALTGWPAGPPLAPPVDVAARLDELVGAIEAASGVRLDWGDVLAGRAAMLGLHRRGGTSPNGSCRLVATQDGWMAINLPRSSDLDCVPALLEESTTGDPWDALTAAATRRPAHLLVERARLLGVAAAVVGEACELAGVAVADRWPSAQRDRMSLSRRRVVDLSSLWAGPLAARILWGAGAEVVKVESESRPDGARQTPAFYDWLHAEDQEVVRLDLASGPGRRQLGALLEQADIVIEASRPRALVQLGADPDAIASRPGRVWLSITGYGRERDWVAFGDDAAAAGGLVAWDDRRQPVFCGDAIADPLAGMRGALEVMQAVAVGGGQLISVRMAGVAAELARVAPEGRVAETPTNHSDPVLTPRWPAPLAGPSAPPRPTPDRTAVRPRR